jgi:hypothetical protein
LSNTKPAAEADLLDRQLLEVASVLVEAILAADLAGLQQRAPNAHHALAQFLHGFRLGHAQTESVVAVPLFAAGEVLGPVVLSGRLENPVGSVSVAPLDDDFGADWRIFQLGDFRRATTPECSGEGRDT